MAFYQSTINCYKITSKAVRKDLGLTAGSGLQRSEFKSWGSHKSLIFIVASVPIGKMGILLFPFYTGNI